MDEFLQAPQIPLEPTLSNEMTFTPGAYMAPLFTPESPGNKLIMPCRERYCGGQLATFRKTFPTELSMLTDRDK